jgi:hypothetical protein
MIEGKKFFDLLLTRRIWPAFRLIVGKLRISAEDTISASSLSSGLQHEMTFGPEAMWMF